MSLPVGARPLRKRDSELTGSIKGAAGVLGPLTLNQFLNLFPTVTL